jgi:hypothetical protein
MSATKKLMEKQAEEAERAQQVAAARRLISGWIEKGWMIRTTSGSLYFADDYNPLYHGPKDELDD